MSRHDNFLRRLEAYDYHPIHVAQARREGWECGRAFGREKGREEGYDEGYAQAMREANEVFFSTPLWRIVLWRLLKRFV